MRYRSGRRTVQDRWSVALLIVVALLSACGGLPTKRINTDFAERNWEIRRVNLDAVQSFGLKGRVAEAGLAGARGDLDWTQSGERFDIRISGPLGVGALAISGDPRSVEIRSKEGVTVSSSPEATMQQQLGWSLPLGLLRYWALGVPAPVRPGADPLIRLDDAGRALSFAQAGWTIEFTEYRVVGAYALPRRLMLADGQRSFRLVIDEWRQMP